MILTHFAVCFVLFWLICGIEFVNRERIAWSANLLLAVVTDVIGMAISTLVDFLRV